MNTSNITNYKPKSVAELLGCLLRHYNVETKKEFYRQTELQLIGIITLMICRLYGLRKYKKQIEMDEEIAKELQNGNKSDRGTESQNS